MKRTNNIFRLKYLLLILICFSISYPITAITSKKEKSEENNWGPGPQSSYPWWLGARTGNYTGATIDIIQSPDQLNRNLDFIDLWCNYQIMKSSYKDDNGNNIPVDEAIQMNLDWMKGGTGDDAAYFDSKSNATILSSSSYWNNLRNPAKKNQAYKINIPWIPNHAAKSGYWKLWFDFAKGTYNNIFHTLGKRMAFGDWYSGRNCHRVPGRLQPPEGAVFVVFFWEINFGQNWSFMELKVPEDSMDPNYPSPGTYAYTEAAEGLYQVIKAFRDGYESFVPDSENSEGNWDKGEQKPCPYYCGFRTIPDKANGNGINEIFGDMDADKAKVIDFVGQSAHHNKLLCEPVSADDSTNNHGILYGTPKYDGLLTDIAAVARRYGWKVFLDEMGQHFTAENSNTAPWEKWIDGDGPRPNLLYLDAGPYPDYFVESIWKFFNDNPDLRGGVSFYQGSSYNGGVNGDPAICNTSLAVKPPPPLSEGKYAMPPSPSLQRWDKTHEMWLKKYRYEEIVSNTSDIRFGKSNFKIYPVPMTEEVTIMPPNSNVYSFELINISGQRILEANKINQNYSFNSNSLHPGVYLLHISTGAEEYCEKIIK